METTSPAFAILGHPNEGKSSVVSTLAEDDRVPISPTPGETRKCHEYPVTVDGHEILRFVDTPGFQQPRRTHQWMTAYTGENSRMIADFISAHVTDPQFSDECELMTPLAAGAGIIYVVDGSRPLRRTDIMEMDILRLTGLPRMAVINTKEQNRVDFIDAWKTEARKHFNIIRVFDAHRATYAERIDLMESLKMIDPDWQPALTRAIEAFQKDWQQRLNDTAVTIILLLQQAQKASVSKTCETQEEIEEIKDQLQEKYQQEIHQIEKAAHRRIRKRFKHNIFNYDLPPHSILKEDLFSRASWRVLGLKQWQLAAAAGAGGGALGAQIDLALAGHTLGLFTAIGGAIGAGSALLGARQAAGTKIVGMPLGRYKVRVGPMQNQQMLFILLDRALIYVSHVINWAHSRREQSGPPQAAEGAKAGYTSKMDASQKQLLASFFKSLQKDDPVRVESLRSRVEALLTDQLNQISRQKAPVE